MSLCSFRSDLHTGLAWRENVFPIGKEKEMSVLIDYLSKLKLRERFLMLLVYYRLYITFTLSGFLFDLDQSNVCRDICMCLPRCILLPDKLYKRARKQWTVAEVEEYFPGFKTFIDSAEQEIPRPKNKRRSKRYYSGKKKKHTVKTQYMVNSDGTTQNRSWSGKNTWLWDFEK